MYRKILIIGGVVLIVIIGLQINIILKRNQAERQLSDLKTKLVVPETLQDNSQWPPKKAAAALIQNAEYKLVLANDTKEIDSAFRFLKAAREILNKNKIEIADKDIALLNEINKTAYELELIIESKGRHPTPEMHPIFYAAWQTTHARDIVLMDADLKNAESYLTAARKALANWQDKPLEKKGGQPCQASRRIKQIELEWQ